MEQRHNGAQAPFVDVHAIAQTHPRESHSMGCWSYSPCTLVWSRLCNVHHRHHQHDQSASFSQLLYRFISRPQWRGHDNCYSCAEYDELCCWLWASHMLTSPTRLTPWVTNMADQNAFIVAALAGLAKVLTFLGFVKQMRKASVHRYYRYVKEMTAAAL